MLVKEESIKGSLYDEGTHPQEVGDEVLVLDVERLGTLLVDDTVRRHQVVLELSQSLLEHSVHLTLLVHTVHLKDLPDTSYKS